MPEKMSSDAAAFADLCASTTLAHVAYTAPDGPRIFPTAFAVLDGHLLIHGSTGSRWMRHLVDQSASVAITKLDGLVVARSTFESSVLYRSAIVFGTFSVVASDRAESLLARLSDRLIPGRSAEVRPALRKELAATMLLELPLEHWSLRVSDGWSEDEEVDVAGDAWAGVVRLGAPEVSAEAAPDLRAGIPIPRSVTRLLEDSSGIV
jgi:nitroimidazol reductase NimA-like FMN-containing flavoprotein (pyridoxamine 5'-phosphate oxidase superfamily)